MESMTMDLFAEHASHQAEHSAPNDAPVEPAFDSTLAASLLANAFSAVSRKEAHKTLSDDDRALLLSAIGIVSPAKRRAYERATLGGLVPALGWMVANPALAQACADLHKRCLDINDIPMEP